MQVHRYQGAPQCPRCGSQQTVVDRACSQDHEGLELEGAPFAGPHVHRVCDACGNTWLEVGDPVSGN